MTEERLPDAAACVAIVLLCGSFAPAGSADEEPADRRAAPRWLIVQPGYPGSTADAVGFVRDFSRYLEARTGLQGLEGAYYNVPEDALRASAASRPAFALVSLGFYLEHRHRFALRAVLEARPEDRFVIVALTGGLKGADALRGASVAGGPLYEKDFLERIVFRDAADVRGWQAAPVLRVSRALRRLERRQYAAVVLTGREYDALRSLSRWKKLEIIAESAYYPPALLVHFGSRPAGEEGASKEASGENRRAAQERSTRRGGGADGGIPAAGAEAGAPEELSQAQLALKRAFLAMPEDADGKALLRTMGNRGFHEVRPEWLKRMEGMYDAQNKK